MALCLICFEAPSVVFVMCLVPGNAVSQDGGVGCYLKNVGGEWRLSGGG